ncbi:hypothetical protein EVAR_55950_1 [Eumeta japonica]|uniref:Uncharacterized protein n=1 Tax=Eumeta variegata TaxID=151549 RepID=A0A4C1YR26_EUMVA|nr:hypothetical protein EVAR_55950_1 [Eumeta japonica]
MRTIINKARERTRRRLAGNTRGLVTARAGSEGCLRLDIPRKQNYRSSILRKAIKLRQQTAPEVYKRPANDETIAALTHARWRQGAAVVKHIKARALLHFAHRWCNSNYEIYELNFPGAPSDVRLKKYMHIMVTPRLQINVCLVRESHPRPQRGTQVTTICANRAVKLWDFHKYFHGSLHLFRVTSHFRVRLRIRLELKFYPTPHSVVGQLIGTPPLAGRGAVRAPVTMTEASRRKPKALARRRRAQHVTRHIQYIIDASVVTAWTYALGAASALCVTPAGALPACPTVLCLYNLVF